MYIYFPNSCYWTMFIWTPVSILKTWLQNLNKFVHGARKNNKIIWQKNYLMSKYTLLLGTKPCILPKDNSWQNHITFAYTLYQKLLLIAHTPNHSLVVKTSISIYKSNVRSPAFREEAILNTLRINTLQQ